jgi:hypothetical protein
MDARHAAMSIWPWYVLDVSLTFTNGVVNAAGSMRMGAAVRGAWVLKQVPDPTATRNDGLGTGGPCLLSRVVDGAPCSCCQKQKLVLSSL